MRKFLLILTLLVSNTVFAQKTFEGDGWKSISQKGQGTLSIVYYECPRLIENVNGEVKGVCVDILNDFVSFIKTKYNKSVEIRYLSKETEFGQFLKTVKSSQNVLGVSNTTITEERKSEMKFSPYYLKTPLVVLTNKDVQNFKTLKELLQAGLSAQVEKETFYASYMQKIKTESNPDLEIQYSPTTPAVVNELLKSKGIFSVMDFTEYLGEIKNNPQIKRQPINLGSHDQLGFIMSKKSDWDVLLNEFLNDSYRNSPSYKATITTNLGANFMTMLK
jgi:ABC-type amino acid transport substrate-binding protein